MIAYTAGCRELGHKKLFVYGGILVIMQVGYSKNPPVCEFVL
jgi:hypothetical protein